MATKRKAAKRKAPAKRSSPKKSNSRKKSAPKKRPKNKSAKRAAAITLPEVPVKQRLNPYALGYALAILRAVVVLFVTFFGPDRFIELLEKLHFTYSYTITGVIVGTAETAVWGLVMGWGLAWLYNRFS